MSGIAIYIVLLAGPLLVGFAVQRWLRSTVRRESEVPTGSGLTGMQVAREILDRNGLHTVPIERAPGGPLSDNYDPRRKALFLSAPVYDGRSVASTAIAAHEVGHAIQHERAYKPMELRTALFPIVAFASNTWVLLLILGAIMGAIGVVKIAIVLYAAVVLFQIVTLPVEFDASRRALQQLTSLGRVGADERGGARRVLTAAALTYVAGALAAVAALLYYGLIFLGRR
jgi:uncharacterized protein